MRDKELDEILRAMESLAREREGWNDRARLLVQQARLHLGVTQLGLARAMGLNADSHYVGMVERGTTTLTERSYRNFLSALTTIADGGDVAEYQDQRTIAQREAQKARNR